MTWWSQGTASLEQVFQDDWVEATMVLMIYLHNSQNIFANLMVAQMVKNLPAIRKTQVQSLGWEYPLDKEMTTHFSILAWRVPWTEELGGLQFMGNKESDMT